MAAACLIDGQRLGDDDGTISRGDGASPPPPVGDPGTALWLVARALDAPIDKGGAPRGFILEETLRQAAALQILDDARVITLRPFLHALLHDRDLHPRWRCGKTRRSAGRGLWWKAGDDTVHVHDLSWKQHLPIACAVFDEAWIELLKLRQCHAEGLGDLGGVVSGLNRILSHDVNDAGTG